MASDDEKDALINRLMSEKLEMRSILQDLANFDGQSGSDDWYGALLARGLKARANAILKKEKGK